MLFVIIMWLCAKHVENISHALPLLSINALFKFSKKWKARSIFFEKGFSAKDDGIALENIYYEAAPPSPQGDNVLF